MTASRYPYDPTSRTSGAGPCKPSRHLTVTDPPYLLELPRRVALRQASTCPRRSRRRTSTVPTTVAPFGNRLYLVNARFTTPATPNTPYTMVAISRR
jgi:hypothetical protein